MFGVVRVMWKAASLASSVSIGVGWRLRGGGNLVTPTARPQGDGDVLEAGHVVALITGERGHEFCNHFGKNGGRIKRWDGCVNFGVYFGNSEMDVF